MSIKKSKQPVIVITGAAGNIGSSLVKLLGKKYQVVGLDVNKNDCDIEVDLTSDASVTLAFDKIRKRYGDHIAAVIHLAAYFDFTGEPSPLYQSVNVDGTSRLLKTLQSFEVERFIFASTMLVHDSRCPGETINEKTKLNPKWVYPQSKVDAENQIEKHHGNIPYLILRISGLYDDTFCVPTLSHQISRIYERTYKSHLYSGDLKVGQSFIHMDDLISLFLQAVKYRNKLSEDEIILAGEEITESYRNLQKIIGRCIHGADDWKTLNVPKSIAKAGAFLEEKAEPIVPDDIDHGEKPFIKPFMIDMASDHYALDITKARQLLHWEPVKRISNILPEIVKNLKKDPFKWYKDNGITPPDWIEAVHTKTRNIEKLREKYEKKFRGEHQQYLWAHFLNMSLGVWLLASPSALNYHSTPMMWSDMISGALILVFAYINLSWQWSMARFVTAGLGLWLIFAPLIFWAPTAAAYLNSTLIGALVIGFSILVKPYPGIAPHAELMGPVVPYGWSFSPSSWFQRFPIIILAFVGFFISRYLAAYQLGHINAVWDPFFMGSISNPKNGTEEIITSYVSHAWPVPDAGLGAATYLLEILTGIIGGSNRWRTMPWLVLLFGFMIIPLGAVSITFIIIQPILLSTWCLLCLIAAAAMLIQIPYSFDEIVATSVFLWRRVKAGRPFWKIFFTGDNDENDSDKKETDSFEQSPASIVKEIVYGGVGLPWNLMISLLIGIWLLLTRLTIDSYGSMANAEHLIGSLVITITITATAEVMRPIRFINIIFGIVLMFIPIMYSPGVLLSLNSIICGIALIILSIPKGKINGKYGEWNKFIV